MLKRKNNKNVQLKQFLTSIHRITLAELKSRLNRSIIFHLYMSKTRISFPINTFKLLTNRIINNINQERRNAEKRNGKTRKRRNEHSGERPIETKGKRNSWALIIVRSKFFFSFDLLWNQCWRGKQGVRFLIKGKRELQSLIRFQSSLRQGLLFWSSIEH